jgi:AcrR family transcriptional regulator
MSRAPEPAISERRAKTRAKLLEATLTLMPRTGLHGLSLDAIARQAGVTKGAIYDNYESKDALIVAALATQPPEVMDVFDWPQGREGTLRERLRRLGQAVLDGRGMAKGVAIGRVEFMLYALTHEDMLGRMIELGSLGPTRVEGQVLGLFAPEELPMPPRTFGWMLTSLILGLMLNRAVAPRPPTDEEVLAMFEGLAR